MTLRFSWLRGTLLALWRFPSHSPFWPFGAILVHRHSLVVCESPYSPGYSILFSMLGSLLVTWCSRLISQHPTSHSAPSWQLGIRTTESSWLLCALLFTPLDSTTSTLLPILYPFGSLTLSLQSSAPTYLFSAILAIPCPPGCLRPPSPRLLSSFLTAPDPLDFSTSYWHLDDPLVTWHSSRCSVPF